MATESQRIELTDDLLIVDSDAHVTESIDDILPYLNDDYEVIEEMIRQSSSPLRDVFSISSPVPAPLSFYSQGTSDDGTGEETPPPGKDGKTMLPHMKEFGFDYGILSPSTFLAINTINNPRYSVALAEAYNSWIVDKFLDYDDAFKSTILVAAAKPQQAAEEIDRRASEDGFVGVALATAGLRPPLGHEKYDPIYETAQKHDLPISLHGVSAGLISTIPTLYQWSETKTESILLGHHFTQMWNVVTSVVRGLPERYPDLNIVFQEGGISHVPYLKWQLDDIYMELSHEMPHLDKLPSKYFGENFYFTTQPIGMTSENPQHLAQIIEMAGPESILYSGDFPHPTFDPPQELFDRIRSPLDSKTVRGIMGETAVALFKI